VEVAVAAQEQACKQHVELVADYLDEALTPKMRARSEEHLAGCDGCTTYPRQTQQIIAGLRALSTAPEKVEAPSYRFLDVARESPRSDAVYLQQRQAKVADLGE
jgi:anti-sigma factor RsiW